MNPTGNIILITGGGSGIGRGLAESLHKQGNQVIIAGRRQNKLDEVTQANPGMKSLVLDIESAEGTKSFAARLTSEFPALNVVIHNAGIARPEDLKAGGSMPDAESIVATNILGVLRLNAALLPGLLQQPKATIVTVSSGLAFVPLAAMPAYSASKAFIHSWTESLRYQLKDTNVQVLEIAPPYVQTELGGSRQLEDPLAMPLADFIDETVRVLAYPPASGEILTERVGNLRFAEKTGSYEQVFRGMNSLRAG